MKEPRDGHRRTYGSVNPGDVGTVALDANRGSGRGDIHSCQKDVVRTKGAGAAWRRWGTRGCCDGACCPWSLYMLVEYLGADTRSRGEAL